MTEGRARHKNRNHRRLSFLSKPTVRLPRLWRTFPCSNSIRLGIGTKCPSLPYYSSSSATIRFESLGLLAGLSHFLRSRTAVGRHPSHPPPRVRPRGQAPPSLPCARGPVLLCTCSWIGSNPALPALVTLGGRTWPGVTPTEQRTGKSYLSSAKAECTIGCTSRSQSEALTTTVTAVPQGTNLYPTCP